MSLWSTRSDADGGGLTAGPVTAPSPMVLLGVSLVCRWRVWTTRDSRVLVWRALEVKGTSQYSAGSPGLFIQSLLLPEDSLKDG